MNIQLSAIDEERFGIPTARGTVLSKDDLPAVLDFCQTNRVRFLIIRCPAGDLETVHTLERHGFLLMDTLIYFVRSLTSDLPSRQHPLRPVVESEAEQVEHVAADAFRDYNSHYHADSRLDRTQCSAIYPSWAYRSCVLPQVADEVLVYEEAGTIRGFVTIKLHNPQEGEIPLCGILRTEHKRGIGRSLFTGALEWMRTNGAVRAFTSTQVTNLASQKIWINLGFEPSEAFYTFHKWFD